MVTAAFSRETTVRRNGGQRGNRVSHDCWIGMKKWFPTSPLGEKVAISDTEGDVMGGGGGGGGGGGWGGGGVWFWGGGVIRSEGGLCSRERTCGKKKRNERSQTTD